MPGPVNLRSDDLAIIFDRMSHFLFFTYEKGSSDTDGRLLKLKADV